MRHEHNARAARLIAAGALAAVAASVACTTPAFASGGQPAPVVPKSTALTAGHAYRHGVTGSRSTVKVQTKQSSTAGTADVITFTNLQYFGGTHGVGVVTGQPKVYLVYWGSQWGTSATNAKGDVTLSGDAAGIAPVQQEFFKGLGTNGEAWSRATSQYCQGIAKGAEQCPASSAHVAYPSGGVLAGVWYDNASAVANSPTANQIGQESVAAAAHFGNTAAGSNANAQYVVVFPTGTRPDGWDPTGASASGSFCAWHDFTGDPLLTGGAVTSPYGDIAFTNMPYLPDAGIGCGAGFVNGSAGLLDGVSLVGGHEYVETLTDPFPFATDPTAALPDSGGWLAPLTNQTTHQIVGAAESADLCAWLPPAAAGHAVNLKLATGSFPVQGIWSNADATCETSRVLTDFNNDGNRDVAGIDANNDLRLYKGKGNGTLDTASGTAMWPTGGLWNSFREIESGDFNGDGHVDVIGIDANSDLRLYKGKPDGTLDTTSGSAMWPTGGRWGGFKFLMPGDFNGDGKTDVAGIDANNDLRLYVGKGDGTLDTATSGTLMWPGGGLWRNFRQIEAGDYNNDGAVDIVGIDANNDLHLYLGDGQGKLTGSSVYMWPTGGLWAGFKHIVAGDFNNDGNVDVAGIDARNDLRLYTGLGNGTLNTSSGTAMWPTGGLWGGFKHIV